MNKVKFVSINVYNNISRLPKTEGVHPGSFINTVGLILKEKDKNFKKIFIMRFVFCSTSVFRSIYSYRFYVFLFKLQKCIKNHTSLCKCMIQTFTHTGHKVVWLCCVSVKICNNVCKTTAAVTQKWVNAKTLEALNCSCA